MVRFVLSTSVILPIFSQTFRFMLSGEMHDGIPRTDGDLVPTEVVPVDSLRIAQYTSTINLVCLPALSGEVLDSPYHVINATA